jgi:hypothetical protein
MWAYADPFQAWYQSTLFYRLNEDWSVGSYFDLRSTDAYEDPTVLMVSPRLKYDLNPNWFFQVNTTYLEAKSPGQELRRRHWRLEFEANPRYALTERLVFSSRNRFELRWIDGAEQPNERIRIRPQLDLATPNLGFIKGVFANNETFYDFGPTRITENRLTPFGVVIRPKSFMELRVYYLWRHTYFRNQWYNYHALGILANFNL